MRNVICGGALLIVIMLSGCGENKSRKVKHISVKKKSTPSTITPKEPVKETAEDIAKRKEAELVAAKEKATELADKKAQDEAKALADQKAAQKAAYMKKKEAYLAKKTAWNKAWQKKADGYETQLVALRNDAKNTKNKMLSQKKQLSEQYTNLSKLRSASLKKTRYYYLVQGGKRVTHPTLHQGRPPTKHSGTVKYVFKYNQSAVNAYKNAQTRYTSLKKSYATSQQKLSTTNNKIAVLGAEQKKCIAKIKK